MIRLLHVEDDPDIREIAQMALSLSDGITLLQCESGEDALAQIEGFAPTMVLLDMMMPGMTGRQTLDHIRKMPAFAQIPAVFMTARTQHGDIDDMLQDGAAEVIKKPFDPMALADQLVKIADSAGQGS